MVSGGIGNGALSLSINDFALFGLPQQFDIDSATLEHTWKQLQKQQESLFGLPELQEQQRLPSQH